MRWSRPVCWMKNGAMASRFLRDRRAATAVEFAVIVPLALLLLIGEYTLTDAMSTQRKVTITAHTIADLVARQSSVDATLMSEILNASAQIVSPYNMANTSVVVAELTTDGTGNTTVTWSQAVNGAALTQGSPFTLPDSVKQAVLSEQGTPPVPVSLIYANASFKYTPVLKSNLFGPMVFSSSYYENPRTIGCIPYAAPSCS